MARYFADPYSGGVTYSAYLGDDPSERPAAMLNIHKRPERTYTHIRTPAQIGSIRLTRGEGPNSLVTFDQATVDHINTLKTDIPGVVSIHESGLTNDPYLGMRPARENEQLQMFHHIPEANHSVDSLFARDNPGAKVSAMTMVGMADLHSRARTGKALAPSTDLSPHSMRIVRHLADAGVIDHPLDDEGYDLEPTNNISFSRANDTLDSMLGLSEAEKHRTEITDQSRQARRHVTSLMRQGRERQNQPTYSSPRPAPVLNDTQLKLFED